MENPVTSLKDKVALVTGGSRGIGAAIAKRLAADGATVAVTYSQSKAKAEALVAEITRDGGRALALQADNRNPGAVEAAVKTVAEKHGRIDILVNNAGVFDAGTVTEVTAEDFDRTIDVNVKAVFLATRAAAAHMPEGGRVISIGSNLAARVPWPGMSLYVLSKSALVGFSKAVARDLGSKGITVNVVHPGSTDTDMNPADGDHAGPQRGLMAIPRFNEASDVAGLVAWLAGPDSRSVTGAEFTIDGGTNA
ncbi:MULTISPECIES: 3-oxoacyl-ACP reductase family protein [unclassified Ensifer]|uniref:SDR family NAD(P)-dependent oxidoreductase n=1 Tax=unclassified Ensifer TaxID=2633371 RepID=UPI000813260B|nr:MULTISPECIES: 3-oxoacyl-ACP reductase family protein [unclassified Ensifer]OCP04858.1 oxidoreductase [Ensifer sp. LC14]OCP08722.1 oxidoreductase [Ensifer sp. LC11]OCP09985.1 oxidoreductase [Ensifer sp. LC13]OCP33053.1 oxidoreductase [Ensifer sp. LC499]